MRIIRTAIIGTGAIAINHVNGIRQWPERAEIVGIMDVDAERARQFGQKHGIDAVYTDVDKLLAETRPDLVQIATPPQFHCELSIKALEAGAWVLCEKPLCASLAQLDLIQEAEKRTEKYCGSVFQWRYGSAVVHLKKMFADGELGNPLVAICNTLWYRNHEYYQVPWRGRWDNELGGVSMSQGIHSMDLLLYLLGDWEEVTAAVGTLDRDIQVEDVSMALVRFASGAMASVVNSVVSPRQETYLRLDFQKATLEVKHHYRYSNDDWSFEVPDPEINGKLLERLRAIPDAYVSNHGAQLGVWLDDFEAGRQPITSGNAARNTIEFLSAIYKSAFTRQPVGKGSIVKGDPFYSSLCGGDPTASVRDRATSIR